MRSCGASGGRRETVASEGAKRDEADGQANPTGPLIRRLSDAGGSSGFLNRVWTRLPHISAGEQEFEEWEAGEVGGTK